MSHTITLTFPLFDKDAKQSRLVAVRRPAPAAVSIRVEKTRKVTNSFAEHVSTAASCAFVLALLTWMTVFVATVM